MKKTANKKRVLVTGGAGFIGSHVVDAYLALGHSVAVIDNFSTGSPANINPKARFYKVDIRDAAAVAAVMSKEKPEIVNHQAAVASITLSTERPLETYEVNTLGTINVLIAASPYVKKFIFASSGGAVYGRPKKMPTPETAPSLPVTAYGFSKELAEGAVRYYAAQYGFDYTIIRPSNVFGPRQSAYAEGGIFAIFSHLAKEQKAPTIYNKRATRDYVFVGDLVDAYVLALHKGSREVINIATGTETTNEQVYQLLAKAFSWTAKPVYKQARPGEVARSCLSFAKAKKVLGWRPRTSMTVGIEQIRSSLE